MMRLYKVYMDGDFGDADGRAIWTSKKSAIPGIKRQLITGCHDAEAQPEPMVATVEFEPTVSGILDMLNRHAYRG